MQALISSLVLIVSLGLEGQPEPPTYGQVIEAMAAEAARLGDSRLTALVSDLSLQCLERGEWGLSEGEGTLRALGGRLRNRDRAARRPRHAEVIRKRARRLRRAPLSPGHERATDATPIAREVLRPLPDAPCDRTLRELEARDELSALGFERLPPRARQCVIATDVMGLRYGAAAALLGLGSEDGVRMLRRRTLERLRRPTTASS